jgi:hypothetical protein
LTLAPDGAFKPIDAFFSKLLEPVNTHDRYENHLESSHPERMAIIQPRVGAAAPTLGKYFQRGNPVRVESGTLPLPRGFNPFRVVRLPLNTQGSSFRAPWAE